MSNSKIDKADNNGSINPGRIRCIDLTLRPEETFPVPYSDGYSVYSALLQVLDNVDTTVSSRVHDSSLGSIHTSGLLGPFQKSDRPYHKTVQSGKSYQLKLGIVDPADSEIFQALVKSVVMEGETVNLSHGTLTVESFESQNSTHEELLALAAETDDPAIEIQFRTPTCIEEVENITTMFPHRLAVFTSLLGKWNHTVSDKLKLALSRDEIIGSLIEKPDPDLYDTHSVLVSRGETDAGETRSIMKQGFTGVCSYEFKDASESVQNAVTTLAQFAEYSGVGSAVARGCGSVGVKIL